MKIIKLIGLFCLIGLTFFYTEKVIYVTINQDDIMIKIKEATKHNNILPKNATIKDDTITPGNVGSYIDEEASYKAMKKIGYYEPSLLIYKEIYPEVSIYNNYDKYITSGNNKEKQIALIYIINNNNTIDNILNITNKYQIPINFFIDSTFLSNNINIIKKLSNHEIYNYGSMGEYTKDNLIIANNIINNKAKNKANICLFLIKNNTSHNNCQNSKMFSLIPKTNNTFYNIKNNLDSGNIYLIDNTKELPSIIEYITTKGYKIVPLSIIIKE